MILNKRIVRSNTINISSVISFVVVIFVFTTWCSISSSLLPGAFTAIIPIFVLLGLVAMCPRIIFSNKTFIWGVIYVAMLFIMTSFHNIILGYGSGGMDTWLIETAFLLPSLALSAALYQYHGSRLPNLIFWTFVVSFTISFVFIGPTLVFHRDMARFLTIVPADNLDLEDRALKSGLWAYVGFHAIALCFVLYWGLYKYSSGKIRLISLLLSLAILFIVAQIAITTTFLYIIFVIIVLMYMRWKNNFVVILGLVLIGLTIVVLNIQGVLQWLLDVYKGSDMEPKIRDFIDIVGGGTQRHGTIEGRVDYQQQNIDAFLDSPIFGQTMVKGTGGHSSIWMRFAGGGLLCGIPYLMMIISLFIQWYKLLPKFTRPYYILTWIGAVLLLYNKGLFGQEGFSVIAVILPATLLLYRQKAVSYFHKECQDKSISQVKNRNR